MMNVAGASVADTAGLFDVDADGAAVVANVCEARLTFASAAVAANLARFGAGLEVDLVLDTACAGVACAFRLAMPDGAG